MNDVDPLGSAKQGQSAVRALDLLFLIAQTEKPIGMAEAAQALNLPRSTVYRLAQILVDYGVVVRLPEGLLPAPRLFLFTSGNRAAASMEATLEPHLNRCRDLTRDTAGLHVRVGWYRRTIAEIEGFHGIRWTRGVGYTAPLWNGAVGYVLSLALSDDELDQMLDQADLTPLASNTPKTPAQVRERIAETRSQGWCYSEGESVDGAAAIAAPVTAGGKIVASLSVYAPVSRGRELTAFGEELAEVAKEASQTWQHFATRADTRDSGSQTWSNIETDLLADET
ncbi:IclR family transcriptional regulator [Rhodococcus jostii]|uniref:DNA-binding transcriptional regulator, IclR family n=2 Tax=Rhodococcus jostii TaxID=132919 RepID=A0A1H4ZD31_RHOJO|nr:IclR family transcriptional regulator [Rhodococcus jostii]SED27280.1 DNA-binding transcriptional regulator, IclR family [Rhodococcus jostii]